MPDNEAIPFVLCFDVEPDDAEPAMGPRPWLGFERLVTRASAMRDELAAATGRPVRFNWFVRMDPQIEESHGTASWVKDHYGDQLEALRAAGDIIGLHPHAWRWLPESQRWLADHGSADWVDYSVRLSFETYEAAFGETCRFVRFGDRFVSAALIRLAAHLGARWDLTVEPGAPELLSMHDAAATGCIPSMEGAPRGPYRPSAQDPLRRAREGQPDAGLWMIPLTSLNPDPILPSWRRIGRRIKHHGRLLDRPVPLVSAAWKPRPFLRAVEQFVEHSPAAYLAFAVRSDAPLRAQQMESFEEKLAALRSSTLARSLWFTTADDVVPAYELAQPGLEHYSQKSQPVAEVGALLRNPRGSAADSHRNVDHT